MASLHVIEGDYGLISLDVDCIQSILFTKLSRAPIETHLQNTLKSCAFYTAPTLRVKTDAAEKFPDIAVRWRRLHGDPDVELSPKDASETMALSNLVAMKLHPVLEFMFWVDRRNCEEFVSKWFMKALPFPFNYSYVKRRKNEALQLIEALYPMDTDPEVIKEFVTKMATQCLSTLSTRLGKGKFFYGDAVRTLDVIVYAHIAPMVKLPFPSNDIPSLLSMWPNLTEFVKRIDAKFFPDLKREVKYLQSETVNRQSDDDVSYVAILILVVSATSLMIGFAARHGIMSSFR